MPLSPSATRALLAKLGHRPKRTLGQNFLVDGNIVRKSLDLARVAAGDIVVEIGPGLGTLTSALLRAGATVWAVEKDRALHAHLAATLVREFPETLHLLEGDAVEHPLAGLPDGAMTGADGKVTREAAGEMTGEAVGVATREAGGEVTRGKGQVAGEAVGVAPGVQCPVPSESFGLAVPGLAVSGVATSGVAAPGLAAFGLEPDSRINLRATASSPLRVFKVVANLPYAISTPWMDALLGGPLPARMVLMLQQEAARRYAAASGSKHYSAISIFLQNAYDLAPGHKVAAACFHPRPEVESCLLHLVRKPAPFVFSPMAKAFIRACFRQRRKQLGALLRDRLPDHGRAWLGSLAAHGHDARSRPEQIPPALWTAFG